MIKAVNPFIPLFVVLVLVQALVLNHINFMGYINPYLYVVFIVLYPIKNNRMMFLTLSFLLGLSVDFFSDSGGIHAAASVTISFVRPVFLKLVFGALYDHQTLHLSPLSTVQRITYLFWLVLIHHLVLFSLAVFDFGKYLFIIKNVLYSGIFTILLSVLTTVLFSKKNS